MLTQEQLDKRRQAIGSSEVAAIFGLHDYLTPYKLWAIKTGAIEPDDLSNNDSVWWGSNLEDVIAKRYEHEQNELLENKNITYVCPKTPYLMATPDRFVFASDKLVEIKTARYNPDKWGASGTDQIPRQYLLQCQAQMACCPDYNSVDLVVYFTNVGNIQIYTIQRDNEIIKEIISSVNDFWGINVVQGIEPKLRTISDIKLKYHEPIDDSVEISDLDLDVLNDLKAIKQSIERLEKQYEQQKTYLCLLMGNNTRLAYNGNTVCSYKADKRGRRTFRIAGENNE